MLASQNIVIILCGNKKDLDTDREVTFLEASRFAQENGTHGNRIFWEYILGVVLSKTINLEAWRTNPSHRHMYILHLYKNPNDSVILTFH